MHGGITNCGCLKPVADLRLRWLGACDNGGSSMDGMDPSSTAVTDQRDPRIASSTKRNTGRQSPAPARTRVPTVISQLPEYSLSGGAEWYHLSVERRHRSFESHEGGHEHHTSRGENSSRSWQVLWRRGSSANRWKRCH